MKIQPLSTTYDEIKVANAVPHLTGPQDFHFVPNLGERGTPRNYLERVLPTVEQNRLQASNGHKRGASVSVLYVAAFDMMDFVNNIWPSIANDHRVVLVTAQEVDDCHRCENFAAGLVPT